MNNTIEIFIHNYNNAIYAGETLIGIVECSFRKEINVRAIQINFNGRAETEFSEYQDTRNNKLRVKYHGKEEYFNEEYNLIPGEEDVKLSAGRHTYPFSFHLPRGLPSSFKGSCGSICYSIQVTVKRPWKVNYKATVNVNVISPLDLNSLRGLRDPVSRSVDKTMCCCWFKSGPLTFDISLPVIGYVPGQDINIGAYIQNMSNVSAENVEFKIVMELQFISLQPSSKSKREEFVLTTCEAGGVGAHGEKSWTSKLTIPTNTDIPNLVPCSIINVTYRLVGVVKLPWPYRNLNTEFSIVIGNMPLSGVNTSLPGTPDTESFLPNYDSLPSPQLNSSATTPPIEDTPLLPNPSSSEETTAAYGGTSHSPEALAQLESSQNTSLPSYEDSQQLGKKTENNHAS